MRRGGTPTLAEEKRSAARKKRSPAVRSAGLGTGCNFSPLEGDCAWREVRRMIGGELMSDVSQYGGNLPIGELRKRRHGVGVGIAIGGQNFGRPEQKHSDQLRGIARDDGTVS